jgi:hypothetical protein
MMSPVHTPSSVPRRQPHVVARRLRDAGVLVNLKTNDIFELNDSAMRVWELVDGTATVSAIAATLVDEFDVAADTAEKEAAAILETLTVQGVVC